MADNILATVGFELDFSNISKLDTQLKTLEREFDILGRKARTNLAQDVPNGAEKSAQKIKKVGDEADKASDKVSKIRTQASGLLGALQSLDSVSGGFLSGVLSSFDQLSATFNEVKENASKVFSFDQSGSSNFASNTALLATNLKNVSDANKNVAQSTQQVVAAEASAATTLANTAAAATSGTAAIKTYAASAQAAKANFEGLTAQLALYKSQAESLTKKISVVSSRISTGIPGSISPDADKLGLQAILKFDQSKLQSINGAIAQTEAQLARLGPSAAIAGESVAGVGAAAGASGVALGALAAALAAVVALAAGVKIAFDNLNQLQNINDTAIMTGLAADELAKFGALAAREGISIEEFGLTLNKANKSIFEAIDSNKQLADVYTKLGLSTRELSKLDASERFIQIFDAITKVNDEGQRFDAVTAIFGKAGAQLLKVADNGEDLRNKLRETGETGEAASAKLLQQADEQDAQLKKLSSTWVALKNTITGIFAPAVIKTLELINAGINTSASLIDKMGASIGNLSGPLKTLLGIVPGFGAVVKVLDYYNSGKQAATAQGPIKLDFRNPDPVLPSGEENKTDAEIAAEKERQAAEAARKRQQAQAAAGAARRKALEDEARITQQLDAMRKKQLDEEQAKFDKTADIRLTFERELKLLNAGAAELASGKIQSQDDYNRFLEQERELQSIILQIKKDGLLITEDEVKQRLAAIRSQREANDKQVDQNEKIKARAEEQRQLVVDSWKGVGDIISSEILQGIEEGDFSFRKLLANIGKYLLESGIRNLFKKLFDFDSIEQSGKGFLSGFGDMFKNLFYSLGGIFKKVFSGIGSIFKGGGGGGLGSIFGSIFGGLFGFKNGGAFNNGVQFYANGGIVNRSTPFMQNSGLSVMGEAGPEAILPLKRTSDGKLGVVNAGGSGAPVVNQYQMAGSININVQSTDNAQRDDAETAKVIDKLLNNKFKQFITDQQRSGGMLNPKIGAR